MQRLVRLTSCKLSVGVVMIHAWIPAFNPLDPIGLASPTWITFRNLPLKYLPNARNVAASVGAVLEATKDALDSRDPRFCILEHFPRIQIRRLKLEGLDQKFTEVMISYDGETMPQLTPLIVPQ
jgi:hypothetical protein